MNSEETKSDPKHSDSAEDKEKFMNSEETKLEPKHSDNAIKDKGEGDETIMKIEQN